MQFTKQCKVEKCCDDSRPSVCAPWLVVTNADKREGDLYATDGKILARLPVVLDDGDTAGFVPVEAFPAARKAKLNWQGRILLNGRADTGAGSFERSTEKPMDMAGIDRVWPKSPITYEVALDVTLLAQLAQGLGAERVRLSFHGETLTTEPIEVTPLSPHYSTDNRGLIMPIRVSKEAGAQS